MIDNPLYNRIKFFFFPLLFFMVIASCREAAVEKPEDLIPETEMESILYDLTILNSAKGISAKKFGEIGALPSPYLYGKYNIDSLQFANSVMYYATQTDTYISIQKKVEARLKALKQEVEAAKKKNDSVKLKRKPKKDSLPLKPEKAIPKPVKNEKVQDEGG